MLALLATAGIFLASCGISIGSQASVASSPAEVTASSVEVSAHPVEVNTTVATTDPDESEVSRRIEEADIDPGECGTVTYTPVGSASYEGDLCLPEVQTSDVVVLLVHGGGGKGGERQDLQPWQEAYAELGIATFSIDYRLTDPEVDDGVWPEPERNAKAAVQFLHLASSALGVDEIVLQGHSAGARLGSIIYTTSGDESFDDGSLWSDVSDEIDAFIGLYGYYDGYQFETDAYYGYGASGWPTEASAIDQASTASGDALLITGDADTLIDGQRSTEFGDALDAAGVEAQVIQLAGEGHGFDLRDGELTEAGRQTLNLISRWLARCCSFSDVG